jgi:hypothetical protein
MEKLDDVLTRLREKIQAHSEQEAGLTKPKIVSGAHRPSLLPSGIPSGIFLSPMFWIGRSRTTGTA